MISLVIPTYNERENILELIRQVEKSFASAGMNDFEILVMDDDSPDGTARAVNELKHAKIHAINRKGKPRGLSAAVIDGFKESKGSMVGVIDADLSHPPEILPRLVEALRDGGYNIAVGSRYVAGGGIRHWPVKRVVTSRVACWLARPLTRVRDATSGFFFLKKSVLEDVVLNPLGFKIGLEVYVKGRHSGRLMEVPYVFTDRREGVTKLNTGTMLIYLRQLFSLMTRA